jgi:formate dehydrogenase iron-sulfur subunit
MNTVKIYVPRDAAACSVGADQTAAAIFAGAKQRGIDIELKRNGTRGMLWLEPMVEVVTPAGRIAYGPVGAHDVEGLFAANFTAGGMHALRLGPTDEIPYFKNQERLTFARVGLTDPRSLQDYLDHEGSACRLRRSLRR